MNACLSGILSDNVGREENVAGFFSDTVGREEIVAGFFSDIVGREENVAGFFSDIVGGEEIVAGFFSDIVGGEEIVAGFFSDSVGREENVAGFFSDIVGRGKNVSATAETDAHELHDRRQRRTPIGPRMPAVAHPELVLDFLLLQDFMHDIIAVEQVILVAAINVIGYAPGFLGIQLI